MSPELLTFAFVSACGDYLRCRPNVKSCFESEENSWLQQEDQIDSLRPLLCIFSFHLFYFYLFIYHSDVLCLNPLFGFSPPVKILISRSHVVVGWMAVLEE